MKFFVWLNDQQQGPFDEVTIRKMLLEGQIAQDTLICPENGDLDWTPVGELFLQDSLPESFGLANLSTYEAPIGHADDGYRLEIRLNSSVELKIKAVKLYNETALKELNSKKAEAMKMFKGASTGLAVFGSIDWVLAASAVIGATEAVLSAGAASTGESLLTEAVKAERKLRKEGVFFSVGKIQFIESPIPGSWRGIVKAETRTTMVTSTFVHNGDEFISVMADGNEVSSIRWNAIESYRLLKNSN